MVTWSVYLARLSWLGMASRGPLVGFAQALTVLVPSGCADGVHRKHGVTPI